MSPWKAAAVSLALLLAAKGNVTSTLWAAFNLLDTLRALRDVRPNGRRVGVATKRRLVRQCLMGWVVFVAAQPVSALADAVLAWFPFYKSLKTAIVLLFISWRLQTSAMVYQNVVVPLLRRHEHHIDLTLLLLHSFFALVTYFAAYLPWHAATSAKSYVWPSHPVLTTSSDLDQLSSPTIHHPVTHRTTPVSPSRTQHTPALPTTPHSLKVPVATSSVPRSPRRPSPSTTESRAKRHEPASASATTSAVAAIAAKYEATVPKPKPPTVKVSSRPGPSRQPVQRIPSASSKPEAHPQRRLVKDAIPKDNGIPASLLSLPSPLSHSPKDTSPPAGGSDPTTGRRVPLRTVSSKAGSATAKTTTRTTTKSSTTTAGGPSRPAKRAREETAEGDEPKRPVSQAASRTVSRASASSLPASRPKPATAVAQTKRKASAKTTPTKRKTAPRTTAAAAKRGTTTPALDAEPPARKKTRTTK